ncbi:MAG TPA: hypothetical protein VIB48_15260 [Acidimicrobiia bacterium]
MTFVAYRRILEIVLAGVLLVGGCLLLWGANFGNNMVHSQLSAEKITFPAKGSSSLDPKEFPDLQQYAGQAVDNGPKAKAYANGFIRRHLKTIGGGKSYSQVSGAAQADPNNQKLQQQAQTLFRGETLRGLLLFSWGWATISRIAFWSGIAALLGFLIMAAVIIGDFVADPKLVRAHTAHDGEVHVDETEPAAAH